MEEDLCKSIIVMEKRQKVLENLLNEVIKTSNVTIQRLESKVEKLESKQLELFVVFYGIEDQMGESTLESEAKVKNIMKVLDLEAIELVFARRIGSFEMSKVRPVEVCLRNLNDRYTILNCKKKLAL